MVPPAYHIRPFEPKDYSREADVHAAVEPERKFSAAEIRHFDEKVFAPPLTNFKLVSEDPATGLAVAFGYLHSDVESSDPSCLWVDVVVDPRHQQRGIGRALADALGARARQLGAQRLWAAVRTSDHRAVRFLALQGFSERARTWRSRLELAEAALPPNRTRELSDEGFTFTTLDQEDTRDPRLLRELHELTTTVTADEPRLGTYTPVTFDQFLERDLRGPGCLMDAFFLARKGDRLVGLSALWRAEGEPGVLLQAFTGTRREVRGKGVATELKRRAVEYGRAHAFRAIRTGNDSRNEPMLAINRKLGFKPEAVRIIAEKVLAS